MKCSWFGIALSVAGVIVLGAMTGGCQPSGGAGGGYVVSGVVSYQGKPVDGADVIFSPTQPGLQAASAKTDGTGAYNVRLAPGEYVVLVTKFTQPTAAAGGGGSEYTPPEEGAAIASPENVLPQQYADRAKSPLRVKVEPRENKYDITLTE